MLEFVKMPSSWITNQEDPGLKKLKGNSDETAALMLYIAIAHAVNQRATREFSSPGFARLSYGEFEKIVGLSRAKIAKGLKILIDLEIIAVSREEKTNIYQLVGYNPIKGWAKLPYRHFYQNGSIKVFGHFYLRKKIELNALKLYLLIAAFRDRDSNYTVISYEKIRYYTGIPENDIRSAISLLLTLNLIQLDRTSPHPKEGEAWSMKTQNLYRLIGLKGKHSGNTSEDDVEHYVAMEES